MKKVFFVICIALVSLSLAGGHEQDDVRLDILTIGAQRPSDNPGGLQAVVDVHDDKGKSIHGLKASNFALAVGDKKVRNLSLQKKYEEPLSVIIAVDVSGSMSGVDMADTKKYVSDLVHQLSEDNHVMLVTFGNDIKNVVHFTQNRDLIYNQLDSLKAIEKKTILYQAVIDSIKMASSAPTSKTAILVITDARDEHSHLNEHDVFNTVESSYIPIYTIALGKYKYVDALKKISDLSGGYFLRSPNHDEIVQTGRMISGIVDVRYVLDFDLTAPPGKYTGVVSLNYMGKDVTAQKEFNISPATTDTTQPRATANMDRASIDHAPIDHVSGGAQVNWAGNSVILVLLIIIGMFAISNILLVVALLRRPRAPVSTSDALQGALQEINSKIDVIKDTVSMEKSDVPFEEIVHKLNDVAARITALTVELRDTPKEAGASCSDKEPGASWSVKEPGASWSVKDELSPILGHIERELANSAMITGAISDRLEQLSQEGGQAFARAVDAMSEKTSVLSHDLGASLQAIGNTIDGIDPIIRQLSYNLSEDNSGSVRAQITTIRETMSDIIRLLLLLSEK
ncbi:MAG: VWA domain-containing protein [Nitrospirae bacterium]|nr:VWA domain-containing protein [Nitrospirota bacterium]MBF0591438.1 VWA domain-containing protein [Nitrospirota bacterium]